MISDFEGPTPTERFVQSVLFDYSEGDHEFEKELITSYITSVEEHLPELSRSFANGDTKGAILHSHDIKGSSSYIGCEAVRYLSGKIEAHCKADDLVTAETFYPELKSEVIQVFKQLYNYMESWEDTDGKVEEKSILLDDEITSTTSPTSPTSPATITTTTSTTSPTTTTTSTDNNNNENNNENIENTNKINGKENINGHNNDEINNNNNKISSNNNNSSSNNSDNNNSNSSSSKNNGNNSINNNIKDEEHRSKSPIPQKPIDKIATETVNNKTTSTQQTNLNGNNNNIKQQLNSNNATSPTLDKIQSN